MKKVHSILFALLLAVPATAHAQTQEDEAEGPAPSPEDDKRVVSSTLDVGVRTTYVRDAGFDPYSTNDALVQGTVGATRTLKVRWPFALAIGGRWDFGGATGTARGSETNLSVHRLLVPVEGRFHLGGRDGYVFVRLAPGALHLSGTVKDGSLGTPLSASGWTPALDASVGYAWLVGPRSHPERHRVRFWLFPELGYAWSGSKAMPMTPSVGADDPRQYGTLQMPDLAMRGPFFRIGAGLSL